MSFIKNNFILHWSVSLLLLAVWSGSAASPEVIRASAPELLETVKKHDDEWGIVNSV